MQFACQRAHGVAYPRASSRTHFGCANRFSPRYAARLTAALLHFSVAKTKIDTILRIMKVVNVLNGLFGIVSCGFAFSIAGKSLTAICLSFYIGYVLVHFRDST